MNDAGQVRVQPLALVVLATALGLVFVPAASAQQATCAEVLGTENRTGSSTEPGGRLADAIGAQRSEIGSELRERRFNVSLANATSDRERADVVAAEVERIETRLSALERCLSDDRSRRIASEDVADLTASQREALRNRTRSLHGRLNRTQREAASLPADVRSAYRIDARRLTSVERRVVALRNATSDAEQPSSRTGRIPPRR